MDPPFIVRACRAVDVEATASLSIGMGWVDAVDRVSARMRRVRDQPDHCLCVADRDGRIVGYAWAQNYGQHVRSGEAIVRIHDLFVQPGDRRVGIGRALFKHVHDWATQQGAAYLQWQASQDALRFYRALGLSGDPCPDPGHPFFEVVLRREAGR